jgi:hypothetical protein
MVRYFTVFETVISQFLRISYRYPVIIENSLHVSFSLIPQLLRTTYTIFY